MLKSALSLPTGRLHLSASTSGPPAYRAEIDGLRAIAVIAVVLFHTGLGFTGGYVGVDAFFVISGFLITRLILRDLEESTFSFVDFGIRRIRRLAPAAIVMSAVVLLLGYLLMLPDEFRQLGESSASQVGFLSNVYFWRHVGYFDGPAETKPLLHTWSLSVEEQFYLLYPLFLLATTHLTRKRLTTLLIVVAFVSLAMSTYGVVRCPSATFFLLPTRAWELLIGCVVAASPWRPSPNLRRDESIGLIGLLSLLLPMVLFTSSTPFPGIAAIPPVFGAAAILFSTSSSAETVVARALSLAPLVFLGRISYSLYLWHWPVIVFARMYFGDGSPFQSIVIVITSLILAILSWRFVELPFRERSFLRSRRSVVLAATCASGCVLVASLSILFSKGMPHRFPQDLRVLVEDTEWTGSEYSVAYENLELDHLQILGRNSATDDEADFLLWGDSHGMVVCELLDELAKEVGVTGKALVAPGQIPLPGIMNAGGSPKLLEARRDVMRFLASKRTRNLILVGRWNLYTDDFTECEKLADPGIKSPLKLETDESVICDDPYLRSRGIGYSLKGLAEVCHEAGITLWIFKQVPELDSSQPARDLARWSVHRRYEEPLATTTHTLHAARQSHFDRLLCELDDPNIRVLDPSGYYLDGDGHARSTLLGRALYRDDDHLTRWGARLQTSLVKRMLLEIKYGTNSSIKRVAHSTIRSSGQKGTPATNPVRQAR